MSRELYYKDPLYRAEKYLGTKLTNHNYIHAEGEVNSGHARARVYIYIYIYIYIKRNGPQYGGSIGDYGS
jgi:hypothetical protein